MSAEVRRRDAPVRQSGRGATVPWKVRSGSNMAVFGKRSRGRPGPGVVEQHWPIRTTADNLESDSGRCIATEMGMCVHPPADSTCSTGAETPTPSCFERPGARPPCYRWPTQLRSDAVLRATAGESPAPPKALGYPIAREVPRRNVPLLRQRRTSTRERWPRTDSTRRRGCAFAAVAELP